MDFKKINKRIPIPIYYQLKEIISEKIESGELKTGEKVTSENKLSELYQISRMTVRQAIKELIEEGLLYSEKGKGTFVARPKLKRDLSELTSLTEEMKQSVYRVRTKVLEMEVISASKKVAYKLEIAPGEKVIKIDRLRLIDAQPFFLETSFLPFEICPGLSKDDLNSNSLYSLLEEKYKLILDKANITIEAVSA
ncbi:MAG: GntR family transcriptional regulator, partial [Candidatus Omnitrophica bacterium]|nr:GntR family transcriptional regulator [Candidatus Omnitrophota bacterium]